MCCEFEEMAVHLARKARRQGGRDSVLVRSLARLVERADGGLPALAARFDEAGCGAAMRSWVTSGERLPIDRCRLRTVLGEPLHAKWVRRLDLDPSDADEVLAEVLPLAVDRLTPDGRIEAPAAPRPGAAGWIDRLRALAA